MTFRCYSRNFLSDKQNKVKKYPNLDKIAKELIFHYSRVKLFVNYPKKICKIPIISSKNSMCFNAFDQRLFRAQPAS